MLQMTKHNQRFYNSFAVAVTEHYQLEVKLQCKDDAAE